MTKALATLATSDTVENAKEDDVQDDTESLRKTKAKKVSEWADAHTKAEQGGPETNPCQMCLGILQKVVFPHGDSAGGRRKSGKRRAPWMGKSQRDQAFKEMDETLSLVADAKLDTESTTKYLTPISAIVQTIRHREYDCKHGIVSSSLPICIPLREAAVR